MQEEIRETTPFWLSVVTATKGNATKRIVPDAHGQPVKDEKHSLGISRGQIKALCIDGLAGLQTVLRGITPKQCLTHGVPKNTTENGQTWDLVTKENDAGQPGVLARSLKNFEYPANTKLLMLDIDPHPASPCQLKTPHEAIGTLTDIMPELHGIGWLATTSTSSAIKCKKTGEWLKPPAGMHVYFLATGDVKQFANTLKIRLWLAGLGFCRLATPNQQTGVAMVLNRAVFDLSVFSPERPDFVAGALIPPGASFFQDRPEPILSPGSIADLDALPVPTREESAEYRTRLHQAKASLRLQREQHVAHCYRAMHPDADSATVQHHVNQQIARADAGELSGSHRLYLDDGRVVSFDDLGKDDDGITLADPLEGLSYGRTKAYFHWNKGKPFILSLAHGVKTRYTQLHDNAADFCINTVNDVQNRMPRLVAIRATHGTGKTERIIKPLVAESERAVVIGHRVALARDTANRLNLDCYQDIKADFVYAVDHLAICINSLPASKYQSAPAMEAPDVVVLDEAEQIITSIANAGTMKNSVGRVTDRLKELCRTAKQVVLSDADLSEQTVKFFEKFLSCEAEWYTHEPKQPDITVVIQDYKAGITQLDHDLKHKNVLVTADSAKSLRQLSRIVPAHKSSLLITHETTGGKAQKAFLSDPEAALSGINTLLYSPTVGSGVSLTTPRFDVHYVIYTGTIPPAEIIQQARRDRTAKHIILLMKGVCLRPQLEADPAKLAQSIKLANRIEYREAAVHFSAFDDLRIRTMAATNKAMRNARDSLFRLLKKRGYTIIIDDNSTKNTELVRAISEQEEQARRTEIQEAEPLDNVTYAYIETGQRALTPALAVQYERHRITDALALADDAPIEPEHFDLWANGKGESTIKRAINVFGSQDTSSTSSDHQQIYEYSLRQFPVLQQRLYSRVLIQLGIDRQTGEGSFDHEQALSLWHDLKITGEGIAALVGITIPEQAPKYPTRWAVSLLKGLGLKTISQQTRANNRRRTYQITADSWALMQDIIHRHQPDDSGCHTQALYIF